LRWAVIAAQHKSLRQAAETLNIRQSTLSRGLRNLEHQLGAILFERTNGGTRPTLAGEEFLDAARRIIKEAEAIAARVKMRSRGEDYDADAVIPETMALWRATYRALPETHQMIAATIIWLYRGGPDTVWLRRVPVAWPATDAIALLRAAAALPDRGLLVSRYPGW
jgi:hypothetical protein